MSLFLLRLPLCLLHNVYFLFIELLDESAELRDTGKKIMHAAVIEIDSLREQLSVSGFRDWDTALKGMRVLIAVDRFYSNPPGTFDAILMDIMMPVMDGLTAARCIRKSGYPQAQEIPIPAMTANACDEDVKKTKEAGMNGHLSKPVDTDLLFRALKTLHVKPFL